jgi:hypothetical protein
MTALARHRDLLSAGVALGFLLFVLGTVAVKSLTGGNHADAAPAAEPAHSETVAPPQD